ncbi:MAG: glycoside hydrolase family 16 protein [Gammaproteobacteria bacterium]|nr:glycoside hydrolase family 16 protein [Gammaproteobacteria bacterium]
MGTFRHVMLVALGLGLGGAMQPAESSCSAGNCVLVWADEFDGSTVDENKWEYMIGDGSNYGIPGWGNNELQYYRPENATVANGELTITAKQEFFGGRSYTSARLRTLGRGDWQYGRMEMRAKLPEGQGLWPAFWMLSSTNLYGGWAATGEIDIMESLGQQPERIYGTIHYGGEFPENTFSGASTFLPAGSADEFHEYAIEWEEGEIRWYVDGQLYSTKTNWYSTAAPYPAPFDQPFHLLLNVAVGGNFPGNPDASTVFPQQLVVDYVRVYQLPEDVVAPVQIFDDMEHGAPFSNGWFAFNSDIGGGGVDANSSDLPPQNGGNRSIQTGWGSGGQPGYFGGFGRNNALELTPQVNDFRFWINPDAGQDYRLEINLVEDDNGDGQVDQNNDDEFQFVCEISASGPCAVAGGGWQLVTIPLSSFNDDNSFYFGGNGVLDAVSVANGGNGRLHQIVLAVISNSGADVTFRTDYWSFHGQLADIDQDGVADIADNCSDIINPDQTDADGDSIGNACDADIGGAAGSDDCIVNFVDLNLVSEAFFTTPGNPDWNASADFTGPDGSPDGLINFLDLGILANSFFQPPGPSGLQNDCD